MNLDKVKSLAMDKVNSLDVSTKDVKKVVSRVDKKLPVKMLSKEDVRKEQFMVVGASIVLVAFVAGASFALLKKKGCKCGNNCSCGCKCGNKSTTYKHHTEHKIGRAHV